MTAAQILPQKSPGHCLLLPTAPDLPPVHPQQQQNPHYMAPELGKGGCWSLDPTAGAQHRAGAGVRWREVRRASPRVALHGTTGPRGGAGDQEGLAGWWGAARKMGVGGKLFHERRRAVSQHGPRHRPVAGKLLRPGPQPGAQAREPRWQGGLRHSEAAGSPSLPPRASPSQVTSWPSCPPVGWVDNPSGTRMFFAHSVGFFVSLNALFLVFN